MFGNAAPAVSSGTTALRAPPAIGMPNAPAANNAGGLGFMGGGMMAANAGRQPMMPSTAQGFGFGAPNPNAANMPSLAQLQAKTGNAFGNVMPPGTPPTFGGMTAQQPMQQNPGLAAAVGKIFQGMHPQTQQALRAIPRDTMMQLHQAGLIHPGLMGHLYGDRR